jgi:transcriptional regulator with XRE-family HTH domain
MTRNPRIHLINDNNSEHAPPSHLKKQEFGRRLYRITKTKGWSQADLSRQSGVPKDAVSRYINGKSLPSHENLLAIANALGVTETDLLGNLKEAAINQDIPSVELKASTSDPRVAWLTVNRLVTMATAIKVAALLEEDVVPD